MIVDKKLRSQLLKDVLGRANKLEKQEHEEINKKQLAIADKNIALLKKWNELIERSKRNECPKDASTSRNHKSINDMSMEEFNEYIAANNKYTAASFAYFNESFSINTERVDIIKEIMESLVELWNIGDDEKWLLLSIALRSQPNLLRYMK
jgi:hypothetical protein